MNIPSFIMTKMKKKQFSDCPFWMQLFHDAAAAHDRITQSTAQAPQLLASDDFNEVEGVLNGLSPWVIIQPLVALLHADAASSL